MLIWFAIYVGLPLAFLFTIFVLHNVIVQFIGQFMPSGDALAVTLIIYLVLSLILLYSLARRPIKRNLNRIWIRIWIRAVFKRFAEPEEIVIFQYPVARLSYRGKDPEWLRIVERRQPVTVTQTDRRIIVAERRSVGRKRLLEVRREQVGKTKLITNANNVAFDLDREARVLVEEITLKDNARIIFEIVGDHCEFRGNRLNLWWKRENVPLQR